MDLYLHRVSVSRAIKPFAEPGRPPDWFSQKVGLLDLICQNQQHCSKTVCQTLYIHCSRTDCYITLLYVMYSRSHGNLHLILVIICYTK